MDSSPKENIVISAQNVISLSSDLIDKKKEYLVCFYLNESIGENLKRAKEVGHTRFPLREDKKGKILGFVHMKDVIWHLEHGEIINLFDLARPLLFFAEDKTLENALIEFQTRKE